MKRLLPILAVLILGFVLVSFPAGALYGPDPNGVPDEFNIRFTLNEPDDPEADNQGLVRIEDLLFQRSDGWDFGDRESYRCASVEYVSGGEVAFRLIFERVSQVVGKPPGEYVRINDRGGVENNDGPNPVPFPPGADPDGDGDACGSGAGQGAATWDGTDHFPHHTHQHFFANGSEILKDNGGPLLNLERPDCDRDYWVPGDEPGEAWLWWDEDLPENDGHHDLGCGGGGGEAVAVLRLTVQDLAPGYGVCTHDDLDGSRCMGEVPDPSPSPSPTVSSSPSPSPTESPSPSESPTPEPPVCEVLFTFPLPDGSYLELRSCA